MNEDTTNASLDYARLFAAIRLMVEALQVAHQCLSNPWCDAATRVHALKAIEAAMRCDAATRVHALKAIEAAMTSLADNATN